LSPFCRTYAGFGFVGGALGLGLVVDVGEGAADVAAVVGAAAGVETAVDGSADATRSLSAAQPDPTVSAATMTAGKARRRIRVMPLLGLLSSGRRGQE